MKNLLFTFVILAPIWSMAQVGVNTTVPATTLDVTAKNSTGTSTAADGLLIPRVDRQRAQSMTGVPVSTLIYVNSIATGTAAGTAINIDIVGYYYYDGTVWTKLNIPVNIYNADGILTENRTVTQGANTLTFTGIQTNAFSVDGNTFSVDAANDRVGVGTTAPLNKMVVVGTNAQPSALGTAATNATFRVDGNTNHALDFGTYTNFPYGSYISSQNKTCATCLPLLLNPAGVSVGIATDTTQKKLHINGDLQVTGEVNVGGNAISAGSAGTAGQLLTSGGAGVAPSWKTLNVISGSISGTYYVQGTTSATANQGQIIDVPGVAITLTVPTGITQTFLFTIMGYALAANGDTTQGVFSLVRDGFKISSAFVSKAGIFQGSGGGTALTNMPIPVTFIKSVTLTAGTYNFKVQYSAWSGSASVNIIPSSYGGYSGDTEAMLTKMQILVYNN